jgi:MFS family permease
MQRLCALLFLHQSCGCFFNPAQSAAVPRLVDRSRLLAANALTAGAAHAAKILGPAIAGTLVAALGWRACLYADAASFVLSALALATLPQLAAAAPPRPSQRPALGGDRRRLAHRLGVPARQAPGARNRASRHDRDDGARRFPGGDRRVRTRPARSRTAQHGPLALDARRGAILGAFAIARGLHRQPKQRLVCGGILALALGFALLAMARSLGLAAGAIFVLGAGAAAVIVPAQTLVQEETPPALLGRVTSAAVSAIGLAQGRQHAAGGAIVDQARIHALAADARGGHGNVRLAGLSTAGATRRATR